MNRRQMITTTGLGAAGFVVGAGFTAPACGVSKEKAVKYAGFAIGYLKDILPILSSFGGGNQLTDLINKAIPLMEKLKTALDNSEFPTAGNTFDMIEQVLGQISNALFQLPANTTRDSIMGIVTLVNVTIRTIGLFVKSDTPPSAMPSNVPGSIQRAANPDAIRRAHDATRF